jgi:hypothetical protein
VRIRLAALCVLTLALLIGRPAPASAQNDTPKNAVSVTGMFKNFSGDGDFYKGFGVDYRRDVHEHGMITVRIIGQFEYYTDDGDHITAYLGGVQFAAHPGKRISPFVEASFGVLHWGSNEPLLQWDGGADYRIKEKSPWAIRGTVGMATAWETDGDAFNALRVTVGVTRMF